MRADGSLPKGARSDGCCSAKASPCAAAAWPRRRPPTTRALTTSAALAC